MTPACRTLTECQDPVRALSASPLVVHMRPQDGDTSLCPHGKGGEPRELEQLPREHTAGEWESWDSKPRPLSLEPGLLACLVV